MNDILLASGNKNKVREFKEILESNGLSYNVLSLSDIGFTGDIEENGNTFEENAFIKARAVASDKYITVADDSGLCVDVLNGRPGIYSARYAGPEHDTKKNNQKLLEDLKDEDNRNAHFVCCIACILPNGKEFSVEGYCYGKILYEERGEGGFGYDPLFYIEDKEKSLGELSGEEKNKISHRSDAIHKFALKLKETAD